MPSPERSPVRPSSAERAAEAVISRPAAVSSGSLKFSYTLSPAIAPAPAN